LKKEREIIKFCKKHNDTVHVLDTQDTYRCRKCRVLLIDKRRKRLKQEAVTYKGGCCSRCKYNNCLSALEFHHTDPTKKDFSISTSSNSRSWEKIKNELDKCILVCANCHREIHEEINEINRNKLV
jgi:hypothetical protein